MSNRRRLAAPRVRVDPFMLARLFRADCPECGGRKLRWMTPGAAAAQGLDLVEMEELMADTGGIAEVWHCPSCGEYGAFGGPQWS